MATTLNAVTFMGKNYSTMQNVVQNEENLTFQDVEYHPITAKDQSKIHQFGKKVLPGLFLGYALYAVEAFGRVTYWLQTLRSWRRWTHRKSTRKDSMRKR